MPFALNESTEFISPTKTLEYMAAGKPVVSTPIHDVKAMFGDIVAIAATPDAFIAACRDALAEPAAQRSLREDRMSERVRQHSWDIAAETIRRSLAALLAAPRPGQTAAGSSAADVSRARHALGVEDIDAAQGGSGSKAPALRKVASAA
jgi:hypothetical protein